MTAADMVQHVQRMNRKWRKRFKDADIENEAEEFAKVVAHRPVRLVEAAVDLVVRREPHYPTPQKLVDACSEIAAREVREAPVPVSPEVCPGCHSAVIVAGYELPTGTVVGRMRCGCYQTALGWYTDRARAWREPVVPDWRAALRPEHLHPSAARAGRVERAVPPPDAGEAWEPELTPAEIEARKAKWREGLAR